MRIDKTVSIEIGKPIKFQHFHWCKDEAEKEAASNAEYLVIGWSDTPHFLRGIYCPKTILLDYNGEKRAFSLVWFDASAKDILDKLFGANAPAAWGAVMSREQLEDVNLD